MVQSPGGGDGPASLLTTAQAAALLNSSPRTLQYWRRHRRGPRIVRVGGQVRYERGVLERWVADGGLLDSWNGQPPTKRGRKAAR